MTIKSTAFSACRGLGILTLLVTWPLVMAEAQQPSRPPPAPAPGRAPAPSPVGPVGLWIDHTGRGAIEIAPCASELCGRIVWMQNPNDKQGQPLRDRLNEDRAKRGSPVCGLQVVGGLKKQSDGSWDKGWIYDPEQGETFDLEIRVRGDTLQVTGYKGLKFLSEVYHWKRADPNMVARCAA
jgi:uncharacterized protein (DUF2147 family)